MPIDFNTRINQEELMDNLNCKGEVVNQTLRELDFINHWLGGNEVTINALKDIWNHIPVDRNLVIADLGCGSGEMLRVIARLATIHKRQVTLIGVDANPQIVEYAQQHSKEFKNISFKTWNVFSEEFRQQRFDIVLATLFMHHFTKEQLIELLSFLKKNTSHAIIINDIHRHPLAYYSIKWLTGFFSKSEMVKYDAPLSVLRSFKRNEWIEIMTAIHQKKFQLSWKWAFRWKLIMKTDYNKTLA